MPYFMLGGILRIEVAEIILSQSKISYVCSEFVPLSFKSLNFIKIVIYLLK